MTSSSRNMVAGKFWKIEALHWWTDRRVSWYSGSFYRFSERYLLYGCKIQFRSLNLSTTIMLISLLTCMLIISKMSGRLWLNNAYVFDQLMSRRLKRYHSMRINTICLNLAYRWLAPQWWRSYHQQTSWWWWWIGWSKPCR